MIVCGSKELAYVNNVSVSILEIQTISESFQGIGELKNNDQALIRKLA